ncbi:glycosyltransferase family 2 protein [Palleronia abyssalis]|uniref:Glycosyl transferase family 2 n=1 Tax=Palleronia abyssalis TaxID=1501240 RepID=A0A2R8BW70_9RHOB|nr:glycosyltransferase family 2 protein [Palleronia abyssalis]SPJ24401.1 hypothetical protein PAA8504_02229 [Palleronia abyssalis]
MDLSFTQIVTQDVRRGRLLAAVKQPDGRVACFFETDFPENAVTNVDGFEVDRFKTLVGGGCYITGQVEWTEGRVRLPVAGEAQYTRPLDARLDAFAGLNTALVIRCGERPDIVSDWLTYHVEEHGLQAALIVDRGPVRDRALEAHLAENPPEGLERVMIVRFDVPIGRADQGNASDPYYSPDAPGRDNMVQPEPDPWTSPLGQRGIFDFIRLTWLAKALGVMNLDLSDLLAPSDPPVFDLAQASPTGWVQLVGRRAFPWSVDDADTIGFGDHACVRFDADFSNPRWCVAPERMPEDSMWRLVRITGGPEGEQPGAVYYRCVGVRHPTDRINRIVPKSTLIEDRPLVDLVARAFGADPKRPPVPEDGPDLRTGRRTVVVTCMKNEGPFILEWIAYHRMMGVDKFIVFTNDCTDGTTEMLDILAEKGIVEHYDNPFRTGRYAELEMKPQYAAFFAAAELDTVKDADWLITMDCDEFINVHVGEGRLEDLFDAVPDANLISMTWRLMGNSDVDRYEDRFIIDQFDLCAPEFIRNPHHAWGFKTLFMNAGFFKKLGVHRPNGMHPQFVGDINWVNGSGKQMPRDQYRTAWRSTSRTYGYDLVSLNHYACRSAESFLVKRDRGRVNHVDRDQGMNYWFRMNHNAERDDSIRRMVPALQVEVDALMADQRLAAQHHACVAAHRAKIDALRVTENYARFHEEITGERMRALSRKLKHFGRSVFAMGPDVLPENVLLMCEDPEFYFTLGQNKIET